MFLLAFQWPYWHLLATLAVLTLSTVVPWSAFGRRTKLLIVLPAAIATLNWRSYEWRLNQLAPIGDPLIRIDLPLIYGLVCLSWLSLFASLTARIVSPQSPRPSNVE